LAADKGIDLKKVSGSGDGGRITKRDIDSYTPATTAESKPAAPEAKTAAPVASFTATGQEGYTDVALTQMRKVIARRLGESNSAHPIFILPWR
jgi:pyruvate dehydrogenase E2 component (dihydrolipoamide acetyltransferase)